MSTPGGDSRLNDSVLEFIGKRIFARTIYGWGWAEGDNERTNSVPVEVPTSFHFQIVEFFDWNDERRGGIGHIEEPGHIYDGYWLLFYMRQCSCFGFLAKLQTIISTLVGISPHYFRRARIHKWQKRGHCQIFPIAYQFRALAELE
jgi:hypothetical protein